MDMDAIFFIGPQGSGKGTQAKLLAEKLGFFYWEMSSVIREVANSGSEEGKRYLDLMAQGVLLSAEDIIAICKQKLPAIPVDKGIIFDAVPRRIPQGEFLVAELHKRGARHLFTLFIDLPKEESVNRLLKRAEIEHRIDDTREKIEYRLEQYQTETLPVLEYMKTVTTFITIDGRPEITEVTKSINTALHLA